MRNSPIKTSVILLLLFFFFTLIFFAHAEVRRSKSQIDKPDTTEIKKEKLPSEAEEIQISEDGIYIRTKEGKEIKIGTGESETDISVEEDKIKIGKLEIDLKSLEDSLKKEIPKITIAPKVRVQAGGEDIVKFGRDVVVEEDETIDGDVVVIGGKIDVKGTVTGNAVAIGGNVWVASTGDIEGDAVSIGGEIKKEPGAMIRGQKATVSFGPKGLFRFPHFVFPPFMGGFYGFALFVRIFKIIFFLFLGIVVISIVPRNVAKVKDKIRQDFLKSALVGFAAEILILPIFLILIVTIIGIPVALLIEPLVILAALILGYTATSYFVGEKLKESTSLKPETPLMTVVIGILAVESVLLLARVVGIFGGLLSPFSWILTFFGWAIWYLVVTVGFGAAILTRLGTRPKEMSLATAPTNATKNNTGEKPST
jgi:uncharacterized membrane protein